MYVNLNYIFHFTSCRLLIPDVFIETVGVDWIDRLPQLWLSLLEAEHTDGTRTSTASECAAVL